MAARPKTCPYCGSTELSVETETSFHGNSHVHVTFRKQKASFWDAKYAGYAIARARVCLGCGLVLSFLGAGDLQELKGIIDTLDPD